MLLADDSALLWKQLESHKTDCYFDLFVILQTNLNFFRISQTQLPTNIETAMLSSWSALKLLIIQFKRFHKVYSCLYTVSTQCPFSPILQQQHLR